MITELGIIGLTSSAAAVAAPSIKKVYQKSKIKTNLRKAFENAELYKKKGNIEIYPTILRTDMKEGKLTFIFSIPKGLDPGAFIKKMYVFKQHFTQHIELDVDTKRAILKVYPRGLPSIFKFDYDIIQGSINGLSLPIVCGRNLEESVFCFDLVKYPHILLAGETGSGKSSAIRSIITTIIKAKNPKEVRLVLGDLKRSEFHLFKRIEHAEGVYHSAEELRPALKKVKREMIKRGNLLDEHEVMSIDELKNKPPYILVCIDEVVLLKRETDIMDLLEEISSIGRSLGVFLMLSMQRPDSKLLDGKLKANLTVRMGFKAEDHHNSKIIGTPGAEKLNTPGRMFLKVNSAIQEVQAPWLNNNKAKILLEPYKKNGVSSTYPIENKDLTSSYTEQDEYSKVVELFRNE